MKNWRYNIKQYIAMIANHLTDKVIKDGTVTIHSRIEETPMRMKKNLKIHQKAILHHAKILEQNQHEIIVHPQFAIIADPRGAGKTVEALSIIASNPTLGLQDDDYTAEIGNSNWFQVKSSKKFIPINIVLCPSHMIMQWEQMAETFTNLKTLTLTSRHISGFLEKIYAYTSGTSEVELPELILISNSGYRTLCSHMEQYRISRLFIDEIDKIDLPLFSQCITSRFLYYISASIESLLNPAEMCTSIFQSIMSNMCLTDELMYMILRSSKELIESDMDNKKINHFLAVFENNSSELFQFDDPNVKSLILAENYSEASKILGADLVPWTINNYRKKMEESGDLSIQLKIDRLVNLLAAESRCTICFEELFIAAIAPCNCLYKYCTECISKWMEQSNRCPTCRTHIDRTKIIYNYDRVVETDARIHQTVEEAISQSSSKFAALMNYIQLCSKSEIIRKVILFSNKARFPELVKIMKYLHIDYKILQGNLYKINNTVEEFQKDVTSFILVNSTKMGGLNLQECTDIIIYNTHAGVKEFVFSANKYGRKNELNVFHLLYSEELDIFGKMINGEDCRTIRAI